MNCTSYGGWIQHEHHINDRTVDVRNAINNCKHTENEGKRATNWDWDLPELTKT